MVAITVATNVTIRTGAQGVPGPGGGNVNSPGGETAGNLAEFTGDKSIAETAITTTSVSTHLADTSNPHAVTAAQAGAEPAGSIATHAADADAHHSELHTLESHTGVSTTGAQLDGHIASTLNPHSVTAAQAGAEPAGSIATHNADAGAHTALQLRSEKDSANGYAGLDGSTKLAGVQQTYGTLANTAAEGDDSRLSDARTPTGAASGDLGSTYPSPTVAALTTTTGPTSLVIGPIADGETLVRSGSTIIGTTAGAGNVNSPGGETAARITKFTGTNAIAETATTETELADAVTNTHAESHTLASHSDVGTTGAALDAHIADVTGNPHAVTAAQAGAEPAGSIATHAALPNAHHDESHTLASHSDVGTTGAQLDAHLASTSNPHATDIGNLGSGTLAELNTAVTDATLDDSSDSRTPTAHAATHSDGGSDEIAVEDLATAGTAGQVPLSDGASALVMSNNVINNSNTGIIDVLSDILSINGGDPATVDVRASQGIVVNFDPDPDNPSFVDLDWTAFTAITLPNIATAPSTMIFVVDTGGGVPGIELSNSFPTPQDLRTKLLIGTAIHVGGTVVEAVINGAVAGFDTGSSLVDLMNAIGDFNVSGNVYGPNSGGNLLIDKSSGIVFGRGANNSDINNQHTPTTSSQLAIGTYIYSHQDGVGGFTTTIETTIAPGDYDDGSGTLASAGTSFQIQRLSFESRSGLTGVEYGQNLYNNISQAIDGIAENGIVKNPTLQAAIFRGWLIVQGNATDLTDTADAVFRENLDEVSQPSGTGTDTDAIHVNGAGEIFGITVKATPVGADLMVIEDSEAANIKKSVEVSDLSGVIDHGSVLGLSDDDHTQYSLVAGTRAFTGTVGGITPASGPDLATKDYVDSVVQGVEWQDSVFDRDLTAPPGSPTTGDRYIPASVATGDWATHEDDLTEWDGAAWTFVVPTLGMTVAVDDENRNLRWNGSAWVFFGTTVDHGNLAGLGDDDHTQYQLRSEEDAASGYVGLTAGSKITNGAFQVYGTIADTACVGNDARLSDSRAPNGSASGDLGGTYPSPTVNDGADSTAIHDDTAGEILAVTLKAAPGTADVLLLEDVSAANVKKRTTAAAIAASGPPASHALGGAEHSSSTLAQVNALVSDATLDTSSASRPPNGTATGDLSGSYPAPVVDGIQSQAVSATTPTEGQSLLSISSVWTPTTVDLQRAYDEIPGTPGILTSDAVGPIHFKRGTTGGDTDLVLAVMNGAGDTTAFINGSGFVAALAVSAFAVDVTGDLTCEDLSIKDSADNTKIADWDVSAITTATTRTITMPDADVTLGSSIFGSEFNAVELLTQKDVTSSTPASVVRLPASGDITLPAGTYRLDLSFTSRISDASADIRVLLEQDGSLLPTNGRFDIDQETSDDEPHSYHRNLVLTADDYHWEILLASSSGTETASMSDTTLSIWRLI